MSKSRECVLTLSASDEDIEIIRYIDTPPSEAEIKSILKKLKMKPIELVRKSEKEWIPFKNSNLSDAEIIKLISQHPILIERPIVVSGDKAVIARPLSKAVEMLKSI